MTLLFGSYSFSGLRRAYRRFPLAYAAIGAHYVLTVIGMTAPGWSATFSALLSYHGAFWFVAAALFAEANQLSSERYQKIAIILYATVLSAFLIGRDYLEIAVLYAFPVFFIVMCLAPFITGPIEAARFIRFQLGSIWNVVRTIICIIPLYLLFAPLFIAIAMITDISLRVMGGQLHLFMLFFCAPLILLTGVPYVKPDATHRSGKYVE